MTGRTLHTHRIERFPLDSGEVLTDVVQAYHLDGTLNAERDNLVVVLHALTGTPDAAGDWWSSLIGPGRVVDTTRYAVLAPNLLGSCYGTTGPANRAEPFPAVTPRDMARLVGRLVDRLGVSQVALITGGSLGGMVTLEWNLLHPHRALRTAVLAAPARSSAETLGWNHIQRTAIESLGDAGMGLARMVGMMTFRTEQEFEARFGPGARRTLPGYLDHHAALLRARFHRGSYLTLLGAMDAHDLGRGRGGLDAALARLTGRVIGVGVDTDRLFYAAEVRDWTARAGVPYHEIASILGHDAFLLETEQVGRILADLLGEMPCIPTPGELTTSATERSGGLGGHERGEGRDPGAGDGLVLASNDPAQIAHLPQVKPAVRDEVNEPVAGANPVAAGDRLGVQRIQVDRPGAA